MSLIYPILFLPTATKFDNTADIFEQVGILTDCLECTVYEELNGMYELDLRYPSNGAFATSLLNEYIIVAKPNPKDAPQAFRIYYVYKNIYNVIECKAQHISYDLSGIPVRATISSAGSTYPVTGIYNALALIKNQMAIENNFTFEAIWADYTTEFSIYPTASARSILLNNVTALFGCDFHFDNWKVTAKQRGFDRGYVIRYGLNLISSDIENSIEQTYSGVMGIYSPEEITQSMFGTVQMFNSDDKHLSIDKIYIADITSMIEEGEDVTTDLIDELAMEYAMSNGINNPTIDTTVDFLDLSQTDELRGSVDLPESVELGDVISIIYEKQNVNLKARIISTEFDVLKGRYTDIKLGNYQKNIADTIYELTQAVKGNAISTSTSGSSGGGSSYVLPKASLTTLGGVKVAEKTAEMTKPIGIDSDGVIWTAPDAYNLPVATSSTLGGVKPITKTSTMTQSVGVDADGKLWTAQNSGSGDSNITIYTTYTEVPKYGTAPQIWIGPSGMFQANSLGNVTSIGNVIGYSAGSVYKSFASATALDPVSASFAWSDIESALQIPDVYSYFVKVRAFVATSSSQNYADTNAYDSIEITINCFSGLAWITATSPHASKNTSVSMSGTTLNVNLGRMTNGDFISNGYVIIKSA